MSVIQSIQQGTVSLSSGQTTNTGTITAVTAANAVLIFQGYNTAETGSTSGFEQVFAGIALTNGTTVTATRGVSGTALVISFAVVEFTSASVNTAVQYGSIQTNGAGNPNSGTATISTVGALAFVVSLGSSTTGTSIPFAGASTGVTLTNSTTVTAFSETSGSGISPSPVAYFCVVDLTSTVVSSVQQQSASLTTANTTDTATLTSVTVADTFLAFGGIQGNTNAANSVQIAYRNDLTSATNVNMVRSGTNTGARTVFFTAVQFNASALSTNAVQRGDITMTSGSATKTATLSGSVNTSLAFTNYGGFTSANTQANEMCPTLSLTNSTTVTSSVNTAGGTAVVSYEVIEFASGGSAVISPWPFFSRKAA